MSEKIVAEASHKDKLTKSELVSYGLGGVASTMPSMFKTSYAMNFMSDVAGLNVGAVGILNTLLIIWDAINDPIIGGIADRTNSRFGKYRPHMVVGVLLWAVIMFMMFTVPNLSTGGMWVYYIVALTLYSVFFTQFTVPWQALNSTVTSDPQERNVLLTFRQYGGFIAGAVVGILTMPIVARASSERTGWHIAVGIVCIVMVITGLLSAHGMRKRDYKDSLPTPTRSSFKDMMKLIVGNKAVIVAALMMGTIELVNTTSAASSLYYLRCVVGNVQLKAVFSIVTLVVSLVFIPMMPAILKKFGKSRTILIGMCIIALQAVMLMIRREAATTIEVIIMTFLGSLGFVVANVAVLSMIPDCTDYTEYKFGKVQAGFVNAVVTFMRKFCSSFSTMVVGLALAAANYSYTAEPSQKVIDTIINLKIAYPFVLLAITILLVKIYPIKPAFAKQMRAELKERREKAVEAAASAN